jgi:hypothetical protein
MEEARKVARQKMLQRIKRASENDWRAAAEWLRLTFPADYRRSSNTNVQVNSAVQTGVVITEERRRELIAQRQRILKAIAAKEAEGAHEPTGPFLRALNVAHAEGDVIEIGGVKGGGRVRRTRCGELGLLVGEGDSRAHSRGKSRRSYRQSGNRRILPLSNFTNGKKSVRCGGNAKIVITSSVLRGQFQARSHRHARSAKVMHSKAVETLVLGRLCAVI